MLVRQLHDAQLSQFSYLIGAPDTGEALIIDPERDVDRYFDLAASLKLRIVAAADTHIHADYLSGLREMAERGVLVYASKEGGADWQYEWLRDGAYRHRLLGHGDTLAIGSVEVRAIHTPGHTPEHLSYLVRDAAAGGSGDLALASGDFVFVGDVGRPDLLERAAGMAGVMEPAARAQFASIRREFRRLPEYLQVWPGHGAGSACGKSLGDVPISTVGYELRTNKSISAAESEQRFVDFILRDQPEPPLYFARMKRDNRQGPPLLQRLPAPPPLDAFELRGLEERHDVVVLDTRSREAYLDGHLPGAILAEFNRQFCAVAGSYVEDGTPIYLLVPEERLEAAVRALVRVGLDCIAGYITPEVLQEFVAGGGVLRRTERIDMRELERRRQAGAGRVLDVRSTSEFEAGHVPGAILVPHTRVGAQAGTLRGQTPLLVHCSTGQRAAAAVSMLERAGLDAVHVDDDFTNYRPGRTAAA